MKYNTKKYNKKSSKKYNKKSSKKYNKKYTKKSSKKYTKKFNKKFSKKSGGAINSYYDYDYDYDYDSVPANNVMNPHTQAPIYRSATSASLHNNLMNQHTKATLVAEAAAVAAVEAERLAEMEAEAATWARERAQAIKASWTQALARTEARVKSTQTKIGSAREEVARLAEANRLGTGFQTGLNAHWTAIMSEAEVAAATAVEKEQEKARAAAVARASTAMAVAAAEKEEEKAKEMEEQAVKNLEKLKIKTQNTKEELNLVNEGWGNPGWLRNVPREWEASEVAAARARVAARTMARERATAD